MSANNNQAVAASLSQAKAAHDHLATPLLASVSNAAFREETDRMTALLHAVADAEAGTEGSVVPISWSMVQDIVRAGMAGKFFSIGDQLTCQRSNVNLVWDVIGIDHDTPADPQFTHSLTLQLHDCFPTAMQFDAPEAFYYAENGLEAGTYHFTIGGTDYQFTLESAIAARSQLILNFTGSTPTSIFVSDAVGGDFVKDTNGTDDLTIAVTAGSGGKELNDNYINDINRVNKGSNNYKESAIRQWLNNNAVAGSVWTPKNNFDRPPTWHTGNNAIAGFMNGMDEDFLAVLGNVTKVTAKNTATDGGGSDTTTEKFFLLSKSEVYGGLENGVDEGAAYPYYANYSGLSAAGFGEDSNRIKYIASAQQLQPQLWWIRTPFYNSSVSQEYISDKGVVATGTSPRATLKAAPACCVI